MSIHYLITGGLGFIGSNLSRRLIEKGYQVTILDDRSTPVVNQVDGAQLLVVDLTNQEAVEKFKVPSADIMILPGGPTSGPESASDPVGTITRGYTATLSALQLALKAGARKIIHTSSMVVYGAIEPARLPAKETEPMIPTSNYGVMKLANERLIDIYCTEKGLSFNNLRLFNVYGPGQDLTRFDSGIVSIFLAQLLKSPKVEVRGSLDRFRDIVHVDDVVDAAILAACTDCRSGPVNVGYGESITVGDMIRTVSEALGLTNQLEIDVRPGTPGDQQWICADVTRLQEWLGFTPKVNPAKGIKDFANSAR